MAGKKILVAETDPVTLRQIVYYLSRENLRAENTSTAAAALDSIRIKKYEMLIFDLHLPDMDGLEFCRRLKSESHSREIPLIVLSASGDEAQEISSLELGADDYLSKPFSPRILASRVKAILRRRIKRAQSDNLLMRINDLTLHRGRYEAWTDGARVSLTFMEFQLLDYLAKNPGRALSRRQIVDELHSGSQSISDRSVDVLVAGLRKKLGCDGNKIQAVPSVGYKFTAAEWDAGSTEKSRSEPARLVCRRSPAVNSGDEY